MSRFKVHSARVVLLLKLENAPGIEVKFENTVAGAVSVRFKG
jgi:hypothetical protein